MRSALCRRSKLTEVGDALCRRTDPGARRRTRLGRRRRTTAAQLRPVAAGAGRALRAVAEWVDRTHLRGRLVYFRVRRQVGLGRYCPNLHRIRWCANSRSSPIRPFTTGWSANWRIVSTSPAARRRSSSGARHAPSPAPARSRRRGAARKGRPPPPRRPQPLRAGLEQRGQDRRAGSKAGSSRRGWPSWPATSAGLNSEQKELKARLEALSKLDEYRDFHELDWQPLATEIARLQDEKRQLESASDLLKELTVRMKALELETARRPRADCGAEGQTVQD